MKMVFLGPREAVDLLDGRAVHHAVLTDSGAWLVVAELSDGELRAQVLAHPEVDELPHPMSASPVPGRVLQRLQLAGIANQDRTRDVVEKIIARHGVPALRHLLDR